LTRTGRNPRGAAFIGDSSPHDAVNGESAADFRGTARMRSQTGDVPGIGQRARSVDLRLAISAPFREHQRPICSRRRSRT
jgi:hypothetical protein